MSKVKLKSLQSCQNKLPNHTVFDVNAPLNPAWTILPLDNGRGCLVVYNKLLIHITEDGKDKSIVYVSDTQLESAFAINGNQVVITACGENSNFGTSYVRRLDYFNMLDAEHASPSYNSVEWRFDHAAVTSVSSVAILGPNRIACSVHTLMSETLETGQTSIYILGTDQQSTWKQRIYTMGNYCLDKLTSVQGGRFLIGVVDKLKKVYIFDLSNSGNTSRPYTLSCDGIQINDIAVQETADEITLIITGELESQPGNSLTTLYRLVSGHRQQHMLVAKGSSVLHHTVITTVLFTPVTYRSKYQFVASSSRNITVCEVSKTRISGMLQRPERRLIAEFPNVINTMTFVGSQLFVGLSWDNTIRSVRALDHGTFCGGWSLTPYCEFRSPHQQLIDTSTFSHDNKYVATLSQTHPLRYEIGLWDTITGTAVCGMLLENLAWDLGGLALAKVDSKSETGTRLEFEGDKIHLRLHYECKDACFELESAYSEDEAKDSNDESDCESDCETFFIGNGFYQKRLLIAERNPVTQLWEAASNYVRKVVYKTQTGYVPLVKEPVESGVLDTLPMCEVKLEVHEPLQDGCFRKQLRWMPCDETCTSCPLGIHVSFDRHGRKLNVWKGSPNNQYSIPVDAKIREENGEPCDKWCKVFSVVNHTCAQLYRVAIVAGPLVHFIDIKEAL